jgi:hypothetical protein
MPPKGYEHQAPQLTPSLVEPGIIIRMSINLGEQDRVLQFETFADRDETQAEIDRRCDVMRKTADRQRAIHALPHMRRQLDDIEYRNNDNRRRLAELNAGEKASDEVREEKRLELTTRLQNVIPRAEQDHQQSGRREAFKAPASVTRGPMAGLEALDIAAQKEHAENEVQRTTLENEIKEAMTAIAKQKDLIAEYEALRADG